MMKKAISVLLTGLLVAAMSTTAFAAEVNETSSKPESVATEIKLTVAPTYTVTIPETITLTEQPNNSYAGTGTISTSKIRLNKGETVDVIIVSDFKMETAARATQPYTIKVDGKSDAIATGDKIAKFDTNETAQFVQLNYFAANPKYAGQYSDRVVFKIGISSYMD